MARAILLLLLPAVLIAQVGDTTTYELSTTAEALTVKASRIGNGELATTRLNQLDIYLNPAAKADPLLAVNTLPAATNPEETANVSLRGSPSEATGIYLNGVPLRSAVRIDQRNGVGQFSLFQQLPIRQLRVYPSSPPLNYSQASAGVVAIETAHARPVISSQSISLNLVGIGYALARPVGKSGALRTYVNAGDLTAFRALNGNKLKDLRQSRSVNVMLGYSVSGKKDNTLQLFYLGFLERYRYDFRGPNTAGQFEQRKPRHLGILNYDWRAGDWKLRVNQLVDWEKPSYSFDHQTLIVERTTTHTGLQAEQRLPGLTYQLGTALNNYLDPGGHRYTTELYAYVQRKTGPWLFGGGLKPVYDGRMTLNLQLAGRLDLGNSRLHLTAGRHTQLLAPGRILTEWQRLDLRQVALEYRYQLKGWELEAAIYVKRELYGSLEDVNVSGAETQLTYRSGDWSFGAGMVTVSSRGEYPTERDIPFSARGMLHWNTGSWSAGLNFRGRSGQVAEPFGIDGIQRYGEYRRLDASVTKTLVTKLGAIVLYANVNNLLDAKNVSYYSLRGDEYYSRRTVFFGAVVSW